MCIGSNSVNQAQDLMSVTKFEDFPNSLIPNFQCSLEEIQQQNPQIYDNKVCMRMNQKLPTLSQFQ